MGSTAVTRVFCSNGHELDEDPSQPAEARVGCRECGDLSRLVDVRLEETVQMRTSLGLEARHDGERRPFHEQFTGSAQQSNGTWVEKHSVITTRTIRSPSIAVTARTSPSSAKHARVSGPPNANCVRSGRRRGTRDTAPASIRRRASRSGVPLSARYRAWKLVGEQYADCRKLSLRLTSDVVLNYGPGMSTTTTIPSTTWSRFQRDAKRVADQAEESDIRLERRDGPDLVIGTAERREELVESVAVLTRLLAAVINDATVLRRLADPAVLPWLTFLPEEDRETFAAEFVSTTAAAIDLGTLAPVSVLVHEWKNTALVHADPRLAAAMRRDHPGVGDLVPRPAG